MIAPPPGVKIWLAASATDMRRGFDGLAALVAPQLDQDPFSGALFVFRGRRGHLLKILYWDGQGLVLYVKRLERGHFVWPTSAQGGMSLTPAHAAGHDRTSRRLPSRTRFAPRQRGVGATGKRGSWRHASGFVPSSNRR